MRARAVRAKGLRRRRRSVPVPIARPVGRLRAQRGRGRHPARVCERGGAAGGASAEGRRRAQPPGRGERRAECPHQRGALNGRSNDARGGAAARYTAGVLERRFYFFLAMEHKLLSDLDTRAYISVCCSCARNKLVVLAAELFVRRPES